MTRLFAVSVQVSGTLVAVAIIEAESSTQALQVALARLGETPACLHVEPFEVSQVEINPN